MSFSVRDFTTLYPSLPYDNIIESIQSLVDEVFELHASVDGTHRRMCVCDNGVVSWSAPNGPRGAEDHSDRKFYTARRIMEELRFVLANTFVTFGDLVYRQKSGVPMGFACSPMIAVLMLCVYELRSLRRIVAMAARQLGWVDTPWGVCNTAQSSVRTRLLDLACRFSRCARAIDDEKSQGAR